jgi:hypothetical protein
VDESVEVVEVSVEARKLVEDKNASEAYWQPSGPALPHASPKYKPPMRSRRPPLIADRREDATVPKQQQPIENGDHASGQPRVGVARGGAWITESLWEFAQRHAGDTEFGLHRDRTLLPDAEYLHGQRAVAGVGCVIT